MPFPLTKYGYDICKPPYSKKALRKQFHEIKDENFWKILPYVYDYTQLSIETMWSLYEAVRYIVLKGVKGDFVECGVFFGGAVMLIARALLSMKETTKKIWLYDSYQGFVGQQARDDVTWYGDSINQVFPDFEEVVVENIKSTKYPMENFIIVKGDIEKTAPANENREIALLRLDTDTYFSTKAELECFFPKLVQGGVVIIDDYGHAYGARRATDEYLSDHNHPLLLHRINFTNRIGIKI
jgi:hypothetical protein